VIEKEEMGLFNEVNEQPKTLREKVKSELDFDEVIKKCNLKSEGDRTIFPTTITNTPRST